MRRPNWKWLIISSKGENERGGRVLGELKTQREREKKKKRVIAGGGSSVKWPSPCRWSRRTCAVASK